MNEGKKEFKIKFGKQDITFETRRLAKQAEASVLVSSGNTQVLVTVCTANEVKEGQSFFPLTVDYNEKFYAAGKFLGGFMKREARPTTQETLTARLIDRPLRPLFPEGYMYDTFVQATVLSYDPDADPEVLAGLGASACLHMSSIPFAGPLATCKIGRWDNQWQLNPSKSEWEKSNLDIVVSATRDAIMMVEGEADIVPEEEILEGILHAHDQLQGLIELIDTMRKEVGKPKKEFISAAPNESLQKKVNQVFEADARAVLNESDKLKRQDATHALIQKVTENLSEKPQDFSLEEDSAFKKEASQTVDDLLYEMMRNDILKNEKRIGDRKLNAVRPIEVETSPLKTPHGSALFTRGETQVMSIATLGGSEGDQMVDRIVGLDYVKFYLHYSFHPFCVGEPRGIFKVGRRELGHGNLAERALKAVLPEDLQYTIRLMCETLESNGSSSMASVCSGSLALFDSGIPLKGQVAGVAMGLVKEGSDYKILTDILGDEDHLGDMDFKVAGTKEGITAIQMDIKITGINREIFEAALKQAREARLHILGEMDKVLDGPRTDMKANVPKIETVKISPDKIGALIGPGGKNIKAIQEKYDLKLDIEEDGTVKVVGTDSQNIKDCIELIEMQINGPRVGSDYLGTVVTIKEYGAFVDLVPGVSGLVHVSEMADERINDVNEYVSEGDQIQVKVLDVDRFGKVRLSAKAVQPLLSKNASKSESQPQS